MPSCVVPVLIDADHCLQFRCYARFASAGTGGEFMTGGDANGVLCGGTPHGLKITTEGDEQFLYHVRCFFLTVLFSFGVWKSAPGPFR